MIKNFKDSETEKIFYQEFSKKFPVNIQKIALRKLIMIDNADDLNDIRIPPGNHLEALKGDLDGRYSIRINQQYRICFVYKNHDFYDVVILDYH